MELAKQKEIERLKKLEEKKKQKEKIKTEKKTSKISKEEPKINIKHNINLKENSSEVLSMDEDVIKFLKIADDLLEKLPDNVIDDFAKSKDFEVYERVIKKYKK
jgi:sucrose-6-phosphate hydrolase SacC (GH32 family)